MKGPIWATAQLYFWQRIILQEKSCRLRNCIAIHQGVLQVGRVCLARGKVLQYTKCIVTREEAVENCIAIQLVYCD